MKPRPAKPRSIIAHVEVSGTAAVTTAVNVEVSPWVRKLREPSSVEKVAVETNAVPVIGPKLVSSRYPANDGVTV
jgi:hypothetical protein